MNKIKALIPQIQSTKTPDDRRLALERLHSYKYELFIIREDYKASKESGADSDEFEEILSQIENTIDQVYTSGKLSPSHLDILGGESKFESPEQDGSGRKSLQFKIPKQAPPPPGASKTSCITSPSPSLFTKIFTLLVPVAYAAEVMSCDETFFPEPESPEDPLSAYLALSEPHIHVDADLDLLVQKLKDPKKIFDYVKDEIRYAPYVGAAQSVNSTAMQKEGNAHDQASLLIAMLRKSEVPARYIVGNVLISEDMLKKLWRLENSLAVWNMHVFLFPYFEQVNSQTRWISLEGKTYYILPHVWVEAFLPFDANRGVGVQTAKKSWVPLDPIFEDVAVNIHAPTFAEINSKVSGEPQLFSFQRYLLEPDQSGNFIKPFSADQEFISNLVSVLNQLSDENNPFASSFSELQNQGNVLPVRSEVVAVGPLGAEACIKAKSASLPDSELLKVRITGMGLEHTFTHRDISSKALYIIFKGVSPQDEDTLNLIANGNPTATIPKLKPHLYLEDTLVAVGNEYAFGSHVEISAETETPEVVGLNSDHKVQFKAGQIVTLSTNSMSTSELHVQKSLETAISLVQSKPIDEMDYAEKSVSTAYTLSAASTVLLAKDKEMMENLAAASNSRTIKHIDLVFMHAGIKPVLFADRIMGFVPENPVVSWLTTGYNFPRSAVYPFTDDRYYTEATNVDRSQKEARQIGGSNLENKIFEEFFSIPGQSTVKVIQAAKSVGMNVINSRLTTSNINSVLSQLTNRHNKAQYKELAIAVGLPGTFIAPQDAVTIESNTYGVAFYSSDKQGFYALIGGNLGGYGGTPSVESPTGYDFDDISTQKEILSPTEGSSNEIDSFLTELDAEGLFSDDLLSGSVINPAGCAGAPVNFDNGSMWHVFDDIPALPGPGIPLQLYRTYSSVSKYSGPVGYGWTHNLNLRLETVDGSPVDVTLDQDLRYFDAQNAPTPIKFEAGIAILNPASRLKIQKVGNEFVLTDHAFTRYVFHGQGIAAGKIKSIVDRHGNTNAFMYSPESGLLTSAADSVGRSFSFAYNPDNTLKSVQDFTGRYVEFAYDTRGDLITSTDLNGNTTTYSYLSGQSNPALNHNMASFRNPEGHGVDYFYYENDKVFKHIEPEGKQTIFAYNSYDQETSVIDTLGNRKRYNYDVFGNVTRITNPDGTFISRTYDIFRNKTSEQDEDGFKTTYLSDNRGNLIKVTPPAPFGSVETTYHGVFNVPVSVKDGNGSLTNFVIDESNGNVLSQSIFKDNAKTEILQKNYSYLPDGRLKLSSDYKGNTTQYERTRNSDFSESLKIINAKGDFAEEIYDPLGRLVSSSDFNGKTQTFSYDPANNLTAKQTLGADLKLIYVYDKVGNLLREDRIAGGKTVSVERTYDGLNNVISLKNELGDISTYTHTVPACGCGIESQIRSYVDPKGNRTEYDYNWRGKVTKIIDPRGNRTEFKYDGRGNLVEIGVYNKAGQKLFKTSQLYGALNTLTRSIDSVPYTASALNKNYYKQNTYSDRQVVTNFSYDGAGRLLKKAVSDFFGQSQNVELAYLPSGALRSKTLNSPNYSDVVNYEYDNNFNPIKIKNKDSILEFSYDELNRRVAAKTITDPVLGILQPASTLEYSYDKIGQVTGISEQGAPVVTFGFDNLFRLNNIRANSLDLAIDYDGFNRQSSIQYPNGLKTSIQYTDGSQIAQLNTSQIGHLSYKYDSNGNIIDIASDRGSWSYGYDQSDWLITAQYRGLGAISNETIAWDSAGNKSSGAAIPTSQSLTVRTTRPLLSNNHLLEDAEPISGPYASGKYSYRYDLNGNVIERFNNETDERVQFTYNAENQLKQVRISGAWNRFISDSLYKYDGLGRRIAVQTTLADGSVKRKNYVYDRDNILFEYDGSNNKTATFIGTGAIDNHLMMIRDSKPYYYHTDHQGSTIAISNSLGKIEQKISYSSFGEVTAIEDGSGAALSLNNLPVENPFYYTGRELDTPTGLYYYRARFYDAKSSRFLSKDPLGYSAGDANFFRYVLNNPVNAIDPTGQTSLYVSTGGSVGISEAPSSSSGHIAEASSGFLFGYENNNYITGSLLSSGTGSSISGAVGGVGLNFGIIFGNVSEAVGAGYSDTLVVGPLNFSVLRNPSEDLVGFQFSIYGVGGGLSSYRTSTYTESQTLQFGGSGLCPF